MKVIRTMKPKPGASTAAVAAPAPKKPHSPDPLEPAEEGAPVPGPEREGAAERQGLPDQPQAPQVPQKGPEDLDQVPDE